MKAAYGDIAVYFISLKDLIKNKKLTGRDRDRLEAKYLEKKESITPWPEDALLAKAILLIGEKDSLPNAAQEGAWQNF